MIREMSEAKIDCENCKRLIENCKRLIDEKERLEYKNSEMARELCSPRVFLNDQIEEIVFNIADTVKWLDQVVNHDKMFDDLKRNSDTMENFEVLFMITSRLNRYTVNLLKNLYLNPVLLKADRIKGIDITDIDLDAFKNVAELMSKVDFDNLVPGGKD